MSIVRNIQSLRRQFSAADFIVFGALAAVLYWLFLLGREWTSAMPTHATIHTEFRYLPLYALYSLSRGIAAYIVSLVFTIVYGYTMAHSPRAERILLPLLDILQSIPILGFLPGLVLALIALFPGSNIGLEIATVLTIFTSQVWNMTFAFYHSIRSIPTDLTDAARSYYLSRGQVLRKLELPWSTIPLVWNSMMSMAGGWFFLAAAEAFSLRGHDFRLPGIGSYMKVALDNGNISAMIAAIVAMALMIIALDRVLWKPLVIWSAKFRFEEVSEGVKQRSVVLELLAHSRVLRRISKAMRSRERSRRAASVSGPIGSEASRKTMIEAQAFVPRERKKAVGRSVIAGLLILAVSGGVMFGMYRIVVTFMRDLSLTDWTMIASGTGLTLLRTLAAVVIGALWTVPVGILIGLKPKRAHRAQPFVQFLASFPAPMVFPVFVLLFAHWGMSIEYASVFLMLLGTQWYLLFNVIAGASAVPTDLQEVFRTFNIGRWQLWKQLLLPAVFPAIITGAVTAAGGAWNASIIAEFVEFHHNEYVAHGIGSLISIAFTEGRFALLGASILVLCLAVVTLNRVLWRRLFLVAQRKYSLNV